MVAKKKTTRRKPKRSRTKKPKGSVLLQDPDFVQRYLDAAKLGLNATHLASVAGVHTDTVNEWKAQAVEDREAGLTAKDSLEIHFVDSVRAAIADTAAEKMAQIIESQDWRAAGWWLERSGYPRPEKIEHSGEVSVRPVFVIDEQDRRAK